MLSNLNDLLLRDASFSYGNGFTLNHINLFVPYGQMVGLLGRMVQGRLHF